MENKTNINCEEWTNAKPSRKVEKQILFIENIIRNLINNAKEI
jgi:hypothetical protein